MAKRRGMQGVGEWAFFVGVLLAIIFGAFEGFDWVPVVLVVLGLLVGFLNVTEKETTKFVIAGIALLLVQTAGVEELPIVKELIGTFIARMLSNIAVFVAPAVLVVALKEVYDLAVKK